jgi:hypothetical protein
VKKVTELHENGFKSQLRNVVRIAHNWGLTDERIQEILREESDRFSAETTKCKSCGCKIVRRGDNSWIDKYDSDWCWQPYGPSGFHLPGLPTKGQCKYCGKSIHRYTVRWLDENESDRCVSKPEGEPPGHVLKES